MHNIKTKIKNLSFIKQNKGFYSRDALFINLKMIGVKNHKML